VQGAGSLLSTRESRNAACQWVGSPGGRESDLSGNSPRRNGLESSRSDFGRLDSHSGQLAVNCCASGPGLASGTRLDETVAASKPTRSQNLSVGSHRTHRPRSLLVRGFAHKH
jgi:hypothetical protein